MSSWQDSYGHVLLHGGFTSGMTDGYIEIDGLEEQLERFNAILSTNPNMEKQFKAIIRTVLRKATTLTRRKAHSGLPNDPRKAYLAVKSMVYKRIFGGNINILSRRKAGKWRASIPPQQFSAVTDKNGQHRGGNRRPRSERTKMVMGYWGEDRGFILRFQNDGTKTRQIRTLNNRQVNKRIGKGHTSASLRQFRNGNRGKINATNWFPGESMQAIEEISSGLSEMIEQAIQEHWTGSTATYNKSDYDRYLIHGR